LLPEKPCDQGDGDVVIGHRADGKRGSALRSGEPVNPEVRPASGNEVSWTVGS
jgi:hypothetical protein